MRKLVCADALKYVAGLERESVDVVVTDPPYGIGFMGKEWDTFKPAEVEKVRQDSTYDRRHFDNPKLRGRRDWSGGAPVRYDETSDGHRRFQAWTEDWTKAVLPALKPGANVLVCASPRTMHRVMCGLEDAGLEIRHVLCWLYGQGFPKSKSLAPGIGTALKPAWEPIILAKKPSPMTQSVTYGVHGTGGLSILDCALAGEDGDGHWSGDDGSDATSQPGYDGGFTKGGQRLDAGRWPPDVAINESVAAELDAQFGQHPSGAMDPRRGATSGGVSRFFYCPKASREERERGCEQLPLWTAAEKTNRKPESAGMRSPRAGAGRTFAGRNHHPTVKPLKLMQWLVRLATLPSSVVLDPFMGSGTTGMACALEGCGFIGVDQEPDYVRIAEARIKAVACGGPLLHDQDPT